MQYNRRILVLDDEPDIREAYRLVLEPTSIPTVKSSRFEKPKAEEARSFEISFASTGEEALALIAKAQKDGKPFAGGFFDVRLGPGIDGIETLLRAKEIDSNMLFVIVTAYQDRAIDDIEKVLGAETTSRWDFLDKPFASMVILQKAHNLVANWNRQQMEQNAFGNLVEHTQSEQTFRTVLADIFTRIRRNTTEISKSKDSTAVQSLVQNIHQDIEAAENVVRKFSEVFASPAAKTPKAA